jgi:hypothetical protein
VDKTVLINQSGSLGDVLFLQKMGISFIEEGYVVYWPIIPKYRWIENYITVEHLHFHNSPQTPAITINCQHSIEENHPYDVMSCKYKMIKRDHPHLSEKLVNLTHDDYEKYIRITRNQQKEDELYYNVLGLRDGEKFVFVNKNYGINQTHNGVYDNIGNKSFRVVSLDFIPNYTLFDWSKVLENASEIHTVDTSINYLIDTLKLKANVLNLYPRHPDHTKKCLSNIFKTKWNWM